MIRVTRRVRRQGFSSARQSSDSSRQAMTLIELLVVVGIAVILAAAAVPLVKPAIQDAKLREASRQINVFFSAARARAIEKGRPVGVWIARSAPGANASMDLYIAETPLPYAGDFIGATATLEDFDSNDIVDGATIDSAQGVAFPTLVQVGDRIRFDYKGPFYRITAIDSATYEITFAVPSGVPAPANEGALVPYQVYRQPKKSSASPLQLNGSIAIDLQYSGIGAVGTQFDASLTNVAGTPPVLNRTPVVVMFDEGGAMSRIYGSYQASSGSIPGSGVAPRGTVHLLLGSFDQTTPAPDPTTGVSSVSTAERNNLEDQRNVWISIGDRNGAISSAENGGLPGSTDISLAREFARSGRTMGGG